MDNFTNTEFQNTAHVFVRIQLFHFVLGDEVRENYQGEKEKRDRKNAKQLFFYGIVGETAHY